MARLTKRRWLLIAAGLLAILIAFAGSQWRAAIHRNRSIPDEPFRIAGNLYYVGATGITSFLLTGPEGHVLIDGGYPETAPLIIASIRKLGFDIKDVKILLNTHAHSDHAGGLHELQQASGAQLWISEGDADAVTTGSGSDAALGLLRLLRFIGAFSMPAARVDHRFKDGAQIKLGPIELTAHITAGHTRGCTSWSFSVHDGDRELLAVDVCSLTLFPFVSLVEPEAYPGIRSDFEHSFATLRRLPADIFLGSHAEFFGLSRKRRERATAQKPTDPFVDRAGYLRYIDQSEKRFREALAKQQPNSSN